MRYWRYCHTALYIRRDIMISILAFRSLIAQYQLTAIDSTNILNGMLVEWQRESYFQRLVGAQQEQNATQNVVNKE